jgi:hypothetical protein
MKPLMSKIIFLSVFCLLVSFTNTFAQEGHITLNQDKKIDALLELKKEMNKSETDSDRYKIQVYSGNRVGATNAEKGFIESFDDWRPTMQYGSPNFKVWVGNFRTRLEADRALVRIKEKFPSAFIFKPKK